ncbi:hypothetical protein [Acinetobacter baumannii]|uniref:hypothetical protein n=1 Tax=Acinetobacter baumannii TaxID=470 RepID=UPI001BFE70F8|nr:hypothetical protein [Acinetobacter baumannii]MBT8175514.1 hypothetical protein [Acinetobacter baumannii]
MQKNKTIWVLLRSHVVGLPPIMTVLKCLLENNAYQVNFISTQSSGLEHRNLKEYIYPQVHNVGKLKKLLNYIQYRSFVKKTFNTHLNEKDIIWLGSLDTALACKGLNFFATNQYILHLHELYDTHQNKLKSIKPIAQNAKHVVVPEINRAGILQVWLGLKERPIVLPNKPYDHPRLRNIAPTNAITQQIINTYYAGKPIILYQGHIGGDRNLMPLARAMKHLPEYDFWLLGIDHGYADQLVAVADNIKYLGSVSAPYHLEITSYASIGIMSYDPINLNNLFCAPNKVWEYSGFGIPFLANKCLSLEGLAQNFIGRTVNWEEDEIKLSIKFILENFEDFHVNSIGFFQKFDLVKTVHNIVE